MEPLKEPGLTYEQKVELLGCFLVLLIFGVVLYFAFTR